MSNVTDNIGNIQPASKDSTRNVVAVSTSSIKKPMPDEARWECKVCRRSFGYSQPINFKLQLDMLKLFMDAHEHKD